MATDPWGIDDGWIDTQGRWQSASPTTIDAIRELHGRPVAGSAGVGRATGCGRAVDRPVPPPPRGRDRRRRGRPAARRPAARHPRPGAGRRRTRDVPARRAPAAATCRPTSAPGASPSRCPPPDRPAAGASATWPTCGRSPAGWRSSAPASIALSPLHAPTPIHPIADEPLLPVEPALAEPAADPRGRGGRRRDTRGRGAPCSSARAGDRPGRRPRCVLVLAAGGARAGLGGARPPKTISGSAAGAPNTARRSRAGRGSARSPSVTGTAGALGRTRCATLTRPRYGTRPRSWPTASPSTRGSSSSSISSWTPRARWACASCRTSRSAPTQAAPMAGSGRTCWPTASASARRRTTSARRAELGPPTVGPLAAARPRLPAARRAAARVDALGWWAAHRSRHGTAPAVLGARRR